MDIGDIVVWLNVNIRGNEHGINMNGAVLKSEISKRLKNT